MSNHPGIAELGIYPAVDPLDSSSRILDPNIVGHEHYACARGVQKILQDYKSLQVKFPSRPPLASMTFNISIVSLRYIN